MHRHRSAKILATLGPASSAPERVRVLHEAGADAFRLNFSHGTHEHHAERCRAIRAVEEATGRPIGIVADLQGPKLRIGRFQEGRIHLAVGQDFRLDLDPAPGGQGRVGLPHPEVYAVLEPGVELLLDDGKVRLAVERVGNDHAETRVVVGGPLSDSKGVNVPRAILPISPLTEKDRKDLQFALDLGVDWVALSFVQRPEDIAEARRLIAGRAAIMVKVEKPSAVDHLDEIIDLADGIMIARGDLGVELPPEEVPGLQKRMIRAARRAGKPVVVATQMLESMIEAVTLMDRIIVKVERDPLYRSYLDAYHAAAEHTAPDAITLAAREVASTMRAAAIVTYTTTGSTALRAARERPDRPILGLITQATTARRLALVWGLHCVVCEDAHDVDEMTERACHFARETGVAGPDAPIVITAGVPFGTPGSTNLLRIAWVRAR